MDELNSGPDLPETINDAAAAPPGENGEPANPAPTDDSVDPITGGDTLPAEPLGGTMAPPSAESDESVADPSVQDGGTAAATGDAFPRTDSAVTTDDGAPVTAAGEMGEGGAPATTTSDSEGASADAVTDGVPAEGDAVAGSNNGVVTDPEAEPADALEASLDRFPPPSRPASSPTPMPSQTFLPATTRTLTSPPPPPTYTFVHADENAPEAVGTGIDVGCAHEGEAAAEEDEDHRATKPIILDLHIQANSPTAVTPEPVEATPTSAAASASTPVTSATPAAPAVGVRDREELIAGIKAALEAKEKLKNRNVQLQNSLGEYFRRKRQTDETRDPDPKPAADLTTRYTTSLSTLLTLHATLATQNSVHSKSSGDYHTRLTQKRAEAAGKSDEFRLYKRSIALAAENSRTGKSVPPKVVEMLEAAEERKEAEVVDVRLGNIKLRNRLKRSEGLLRQKEELADGLHLIDFEQLKIENSTYTSKIESRNEDLLKLRKKITTIVQVLTHVKEKLHHTAAETRVLQAELAKCDEDVLRRRDAMPAEKKGRDKVRKENRELKRRAGLLGEDGLLRDFEERVDQTSDLQAKTHALQQQHAGYAQEILAVKRKIQKTQILAGVGTPLDLDENTGREVGW
ncbi:hypothetical protein DFJ77DRAFT_450724 [Powellomyces hirtus]|nr:hypothetical protein DFJ77DRAFT_450724 [Powellomyces hirtus]